MTIHKTWSTRTFDLPALAPLTGPFPGRVWLETWWHHRAEGELLLSDTGDSLVALTLTGNLLEFAGEPDLTDYHSPLGAVEVPALARCVDELPPGTRLRLDSLPADASVAVERALAAVGVNTTTRQHSLAAVLELPDTFDEYLVSIGKKERHELRRKRRRFENELGTATIERRTGPSAVALFADLHRRSAGDKGEFMTHEMETFFLALHQQAGGVIDVLLDGEGRPASAVFSFEDDEAFYLYNSAYEPDFGRLSPGIVMLSYLVEQAIERTFRFFDFLKGDERYKFRLGARPRPLHVVSGNLP